MGLLHVDVTFVPVCLLCPPLTVRGQAGGNVVRQLPDDDDDAVAEERQRRPGVQRLRPLLQAAQCK